MELYLKWLSKYEKEEGENEPLGIILCADKKEGTNRTFRIRKRWYSCSSVFDCLPPKEILEAEIASSNRECKSKIFYR